MGDLQRLVDVEEIRKLKARYFRCLDTKDWVGLGEVFAHDATFDARGAMSNVTTDADEARRFSETWCNTGREAILAFIRGRTGTASCVHHGHMPEIEIVSDNEANGIWAMEDQNRYFDDDGRMTSRLHGWGHYHERYVKLDGRWYIARSVLTRLRVDLERFE